MRALQLVLTLLVATAAGLRVPPPSMMGRAENRAAAKSAKKKGGRGGGGRGAATPMARNDVLPREVVEKRMSEVPVFRISGTKPVASGTPNLFLDAAEAEAAAARLGAGRVECCTLDKVYFNQGNIMQPSKRAIDELSRTPQRMTPDVIVPVFCIDGLQATLALALALALTPTPTPTLTRWMTRAPATRPSRSSSAVVSCSSSPRSAWRSPRRASWSPTSASSCRTWSRGRWGCSAALASSRARLRSSASAAPITATTIARP